MTADQPPLALGQRRTPAQEARAELSRLFRDHMTSLYWMQRLREFDGCWMWRGKSDLRRVHVRYDSVLFERAELHGGTLPVDPFVLEVDDWGHDMAWDWIKGADVVRRPS